MPTLDRISALRQKAYRGTLTLKEMRELIDMLDIFPKEIQAEIKRNIQYSKKYFEMIFEKHHFDSAAVMGINDDILLPMQTSVKSANDKVVKAFVKLLKFGIAGGADNDELAKPLGQAFKTLKNHAKTVANTARLAVVRTASLDKLIASGAKYFKYVGPRADIRKFCADHIDRIYTLDEILKMDNGQGLPVVNYCGGWNCRHRWVAVSESDYLAWKLSKPAPEVERWIFKENIEKEHD